MNTGTANGATWRGLTFGLISSGVLACGLPAQDAPLRPAQAAPAPAVPADDAWQFESVRLRDGTVYTGLIQAERKQEIEFAEIVRPPGKPMFAVVRPIDPQWVESTARLPAAEHDRLAARFEAFRNRARIEAGRMESVALQEELRDGVRWWQFRGAWFTLESQADEQMTRRCVVRVEQIFRAYRQVLPPLRTPPAALRILLFGAVDDYRAFVEQQGLQIETPAFFAAARNLVVAGSDLNAFARRLAQARTENQEARRQYELLRAAFPRRIEALIGDLRQQGYGEAEIEQEIKVRSALWQREYEAAVTRLDRVDQQNDAKFADATRPMFTRLYHEAFHAYVENHVFPHRPASLPRWLNEGLAQIFESSHFDGETLRIDAPDRDRLTRLQAELRADRPLDLLGLLSATEQDFLAAHGPEAPTRRYLFSWGLAYYLTFQQNLLHGPGLRAYVDNREGYGPAANFTRLVGRPLAKFEPAWRQAMRELRP